jgi:outer membrane protein assembly factor BamA
MLRNLRHRCDATKFNVEYKHNTRTYGYEFQHHDPFFLIDKLSTVFNVSCATEEVDINVLEQNAGASYTFMDNHGGHKFSLGRIYRTNSIVAEKASARLLSEEILVSAKNFVSYTYTHDGRDDPFATRTGSLLELTNEIAFGDVMFDKIGLSYKKWFPLWSAMALQLHV